MDQAGKISWEYCLGIDKVAIDRTGKPVSNRLSACHIACAAPVFGSGRT